MVNKADRVGADQTVRGLRAMLDLGHPSARDRFVSHHGRLLRVDGHESKKSDVIDDIWLPPVIKTSATEHNGIDELVEKIAAHREHLEASGEAEILKSRYIEIELHERLQTALMQRLTTGIANDILQGMIEKIRQRELDPQSAVDQLLIHYT